MFATNIVVYWIKYPRATMDFIYATKLTLLGLLYSIFLDFVMSCRVSNIWWFLLRSFREDIFLRGCLVIEWCWMRLDIFFREKKWPCSLVYVKHQQKKQNNAVILVRSAGERKTFVFQELNMATNSLSNRSRKTNWNSFNPNLHCP